MRKTSRNDNEKGALKEYERSMRGSREMMKSGFFFLFFILQNCLLYDCLVKGKCEIKAVGLFYSLVSKLCSKRCTN